MTVRTLVSYDVTGFPISQQMDGLGTVVDLAGSDAEVDRQPELIG